MSAWRWWDEEENKSAVVVRPVEAIAVYFNEAGDVVIRQQDSQGDDDSLVIFPKNHLAAVIEALEALKE